MTHEYKVGDKGRAEDGDLYEVSAIGSGFMLVLVGPEGSQQEVKYTKSGITYEGCFAALRPPFRRIKGWAIVTVGDDGDPRIGVEIWPYKAVGDEENIFALIEIDVEEGQGLDD